MSIREYEGGGFCMLKEKISIKTVFDDELLKPGIKVEVKYRSTISSNEKENFWEEEINGEILNCSDEILHIKDLDHGNFSWNEKWYPNEYYTSEAN